MFSLYLLAADWSAAALKVTHTVPEYVATLWNYFFFVITLGWSCTHKKTIHLHTVLTLYILFAQVAIRHGKLLNILSFSTDLVQESARKTFNLPSSDNLEAVQDLPKTLCKYPNQADILFNGTYYW